MALGPERGGKTRLETPGHHITLPPPHGPTRPRQDSICYLSKKKKKKKPFALYAPGG